MNIRFKFLTSESLNVIGVNVIKIRFANFFPFVDVKTVQ